MSRLVREPAVAGYFYPSDRTTLESLITKLFLSSRGPGSLELEEFGDTDILGLVVPHAGYVYSGEIAAYSYAAYKASGLRKRVVILGPNHYGLGAMASVYPPGVWRTPLGEVEIDSELVEIIARESEYADLDDLGHSREHSIEVQIPILQYIYGDASFQLTPIAIMLQTESVARDLANALHKVYGSHHNETVFIASTDFTHYEPASKAYEKDMEAINEILEIDPEGFMEKVFSMNISMCGYGPTAALLFLMKRIGGVEAKLLKYGNSGEVTGDIENVVGYASIVFYKV